MWYHLLTHTYLHTHTHTHTHIAGHGKSRKRQFSLTHTFNQNFHTYILPKRYQGSEDTLPGTSLYWVKMRGYIWPPGCEGVWAFILVRQGLVRHFTHARFATVLAQHRNFLDSHLTLPRRFRDQAGYYETITMGSDHSRDGLVALWSLCSKHHDWLVSPSVWMPNVFIMPKKRE